MTPPPLPLKDYTALLRVGEKKLLHSKPVEVHGLCMRGVLLRESVATTLLPVIHKTAVPSLQ